MGQDGIPFLICESKTTFIEESDRSDFMVFNLPGTFACLAKVMKKKHIQ